MSGWKRFLMLSLILVFAGCSSNKKLDHPSGIPTKSITGAIRIDIPAGWNTLKLGDPLSIKLVNTSNTPVIFNKDSGIEIYVFQNGQWIETEDRMVRADSDGFELAPAPNIPHDTRTEILDPDLDGRSIATMIRIYVFGKVKATGEVVGGYVDVELSP